MVMHVEAGSPASAAGLREGDLLVAFDGLPVSGVDTLHQLLTAERIDRTVAVTALRQAERVEFSVTPREMPAGD
jgi:S1-C subfamily serine protease